MVRGCRCGWGAEASEVAGGGGNRSRALLGEGAVGQEVYKINTETWY
jgi:hypothetical protein